MDQFTSAVITSTPELNPKCDPRHVVSGEQAGQLSEENMTATLETTEVHPMWCRRDKCYQLGDTALHSTPEIRQGRASVEIVQEVQWRGGVTTSLPPLIEVSYDGDHIFSKTALTAEECREFAGVLSAAADRLDELTVPA